MKRAILIILSLIVISGQAYASNMTKTETRVSVNDGTTNVSDTGIITKYFSTGATQQQTISLATGSNTLTIPSGAKGIFIDVGTVTNLHLYGIAGDKGISLDSTCPVLLPISSDGNTTIGISNDSSVASIKVYYL